MRWHNISESINLHLINHDECYGNRNWTHTKKNKTTTQKHRYWNSSVSHTLVRFPFVLPKKKFEWTCISSVLWISSHAFIQVTFPDQFHFQSNPKQTKKLILPNSTFQLSESKLCVVQLHTIAHFAAESNLFRVCDRMWICCCYLHSKEKKNRGKCTFSFDRNETAESNLIEFEQNHTHHK